VTKETRHSETGQAIDMTIPAWIVSVAMISSAIFLLLSPMPKWVKRMLALAVGYFGLSYAIYSALEPSTETRIFFTRLGLLIMALAMHLSILGWKWGQRKWNQRL